MKTESRRRADSTSWSAEQLGLDGDRSATAARRAFYALLPEEGFEPPARLADALDRLTVPPSPRNPWRSEAFYDDTQHALAAEVEQFARQFFELPPADRRARWTALCDEATPFPRLRWRLRALEAGLAVDAAEFDRLPNLTGKLARGCAELFVLPRRERVLRQAAVRKHLAPHAPQWQAAARELHHASPAVVALAPDFVAELGTWTDREAQRARGKLQRRVETRPVVGPIETTSRGWGGNISPWTWGVAGVALVRLVIMLTGHSSSSSSVSTPRNYAAPSQGAPRTTPSRQDMQKLLEEVQAEQAQKDSAAKQQANNDAAIRQQVEDIKRRLEAPLDAPPAGSPAPPSENAPRGSP